MNTIIAIVLAIAIDLASITEPHYSSDRQPSTVITASCHLSSHARPTCLTQPKIYIRKELTTTILVSWQCDFSMSDRVLKTGLT